MGDHYIKSKFPKLSDAKVKEGIFTGPDIVLMKDDNFIECKTSVKKKCVAKVQRNSY